MAHNVEIVNGVAQMVYSGNVPWHGLGKQVSPNLLPEEMLVEAGLNWTVEKQEMYLQSGKKLEQRALVRSSDESILSIVSETWNPTQNLEAFQFFDDFVKSGNMEMHTAGSLKHGKVVWALAKVKEQFSVFRDDVIESYLLFSNPHEFGKTIDVRFTPIRVVCNNTLTYAIEGMAKHQVKINHSRKFNPESVKQALGFTSEQLAMYKQQAMFLGSKQYNEESKKEFFKKVYPKTSGETGDLSRNAEKAMSLVETQPGAEFAPGSYWQLFNAVTYMQDHVVGRSADNRMYSSWYGNGKMKKDLGMNLALNMAKAA